MSRETVILCPFALHVKKKKKSDGFTLKNTFLIEIILLEWMSYKTALFLKHPPSLQVILWEKITGF